jgi:hypothetical protein
MGVGDEQREILKSLEDFFKSSREEGNSADDRKVLRIDEVQEGRSIIGPWTQRAMERLDPIGATRSYYSVDNL